MTDRPFVGARLDEQFSRWLSARMRRRGWIESIMPYIGYGSSDQLRILGRVILQPATPRSDLMKVADDFMRRRGWRNFASIPIGRAKVKITIGEDTIDVQADRSGYIDVRVKNTSLAPGWHEVTLKSAESRATQARVQVISDDQSFGLISDIDDTVISTWLPRILIAAWNSLVVTEQARQSVPGMARMYQQILAEHPGAPTIYVSTGAWNTYPFLLRFLKRHGYPHGAMLLTDWGPTNTGWFRSGPDHKRRALHELARDLPQVKWLLIGDDGQHDPMLYREFADLQPNHARAIAIRQLTMAQQVLAHGTATVLGDPNHVFYTPHTVPEVRGADGDALAPKVAAMLADPSADERPAQ